MLARAYRPQRLSELIGQEALVRTLTNAFAYRPHRPRLHADRRARRRQDHDRPHHRPRAQLHGPDGQGAADASSPAASATHCVAIAEGRHIDVLEMDAASRTGIDDMRELLDSVRYAPASARYKVYIIDEVHMLSEKAFNALLKTLEEPPPHAKFIFATTEIRKVPVTMLSRCQRFDLRRVEGERAGRASRRDRAKERVADRARRAGADRARRRGLGARRPVAARPGDRARRGGDAIDADAGPATCWASPTAAGCSTCSSSSCGAMLRRRARGLAELYGLGADPRPVVQDLLELSHWLTRLKVAPEAAEAFGVGGRGRARAAALWPSASACRCSRAPGRCCSRA